MCEPSHHEFYADESDECDSGSVGGFIFLGQSLVSIDPRDSTFQDPSLGDDLQSAPTSRQPSCANCRVFATRLLCDSYREGGATSGQRKLATGTGFQAITLCLATAAPVDPAAKSVAIGNQATTSIAVHSSSWNNLTQTTVNPTYL